MTFYEEAINRIIKDQETIIGPLALDQAKKISGLEIQSSGEVKIIGNGKTVLNSLVTKYSDFFGQASIEVCKDAIRDIKASIPSQDLPDVLR